MRGLPQDFTLTLASGVDRSGSTTRLAHDSLSIAQCWSFGRHVTPYAVSQPTRLLPSPGRW